MKTNIKESFDIFSYSAGEGHYSGNINKGEIKSPVQEHSSYNWEQNELSLLNSEYKRTKWMLWINQFIENIYKTAKDKK